MKNIYLAIVFVLSFLVIPMTISAVDSLTAETGSGSAYVTAPYCYKYSYPPGGPNLYEGVTSCNGGWRCRADGCVYLQDCGLYGADCTENGNRSLSGSGCLNSWCIQGKSAIWDPISKKCGCDDRDAPPLPPSSSPVLSSGSQGETAYGVEGTTQPVGGTKNAPAAGTSSWAIYNQAKNRLGGEILSAALILKESGVYSGTIGTDTAALDARMFNMGFREVLGGLANAKPGDFVISPSSGTGDNKKTGHSGIVMEPDEYGRTIAGSNKGIFKYQYSNADWKSYYEGGKGLKTHVWRSLN